MFSKFKKTGLSIILSAFVFMTMAGSLIFIRGAHAQLAVGTVTDVPRGISGLKDALKEGFKAAVINATIRAFAYFTRKIAYDTAVWVAAGGKGQTPFAHNKNFGTYLAETAADTAFSAIEELGRPFGLNLCKIPDVKVDLAMRVGLNARALANYAPVGQQGPQPVCSWADFQKGWGADAWRSQFSRVGSVDITDELNKSFSVDQTDLGIFLAATEKVDNIVAQQVATKAKDREEGQGYKPVEGIISGDIKVPAANVKEEAQSQNPSEQVKKAEATLSAQISSGVWQSLPGTFALMFNTLAGQMIKNYREKGMLLGSCVSDACRQSDLLSQYEGLTKGGRQAAQELFSDLLTPKTTEIDRYDMLTNFSNCPDSPGPENCVADESLVQAAQEANYGQPITVAEALAKNWLHGEWKLLSADRTADNTDRTCYQRAYCYANVVKLRKARILPLGFEIAALNSNPDKPWTLKQVVDGFADCNYIKDPAGNVIGVTNDPINKPFCHLIDPNWVIKYPLAKCNVMAYGPSLLLPDAPNRAQECVDLTSCVAFDKDGNCAAQGYCTREKNSWRIGAAQCDSQYRTCRTFQDSAGKTVSYLYRTLDTGFCNQDNTGCAAYSLKKDASGNWTGYAAADLAIGENSAIYFNNKISGNCSPNADGCSVFKTASTSENLYLRKAPYYLSCYDADTSTPAINWPQTVSDLNKLTANPACGSFASACIPDEVNCDWYNPASYSGDRIPGKFTPAAIVENQIVWNDQCDKRCVGYAAYREMPSNYAGGQSVAYVIPSSGAKCGASEEGCASFTNLGATAGGVEKTEYYSYLRPCILPDAAKQKSFYTYEGSTVGGYQLRVFILEKDTDGSPKYFYRTSDDLTGYNLICNESLYKGGAASPDCRQFNDDAGNVYYKLLAKTIAVSPACTPYRLNDTELIAPETCFQNGEYRDGQCFYYGLPGGVQNTAGVSNSCAAEVNTCRAYKGNAGNNVRNIFNNSFEDSSTTIALANWGPAPGIALSAESTHVGEHSLAYTGVAEVYKNLALTPGRSYDLTFWAKGSAGSVSAVTLANDASVNFGSVSVGDTWRLYHLGPIELAGTATSTQLQFSAAGTLFLDNVILKEVADYLYLVKNTLKVDSVCDSNLNDNLPGESLGCSEYRAGNNTPVYLTGFASLCREKAIGCAAVYDTRNTLSDTGARAYNVWLAGASGEQVTRAIGGVSYSCQIAVGQSGCYVNVRGASLDDITAGGGAVVASTIFIPADTPSAAPIYLVANKAATCNAVDLGCVKAAKVSQTPAGPTYGEVLIKNDPESYNSTLCQSEAVGCNAYGFGDGKLYFKDPAVAGQKICEYKKDITIGSEKFSGWFWKGVGKCAGADQFCTSDANCAGGAKCENTGEQPCYPSYLQSGNNYGLWSYGTAGQYNNFAGECPASQNGCTEYIDHNDNNKYYYLINNEDLAARQSECNGQVSEKYGCILLDKTDQPNKFWTASSTYYESARKDFALVAPSSTAANDSNAILKVSKDRECGEWLQCRSSHRVWDAAAGKYKEVCDALGRCNQAASANSAAGSDITNCANWVDGTHELANNLLTDGAYRNRATSWEGMDFSGYSILDKYPLEELSEADLDFTGKADWRLVRKIGCGGINCKDAARPESFECATEGNACGRNFSGVCKNKICVQTPEGGTANVAGKSPAQTCRAYPEEGSPFANNKEKENISGYNGANLCQETGGFTLDKTKAYACECDYSKVSYGDQFTKYWNYYLPNNFGLPNKKGQTVIGIAPGICSGGDFEGRACSVNSDCTDQEGGSATCVKVKRESKFIGWRGYCLEPDTSRQLNGEPNNYACLTWYPIDTISGALDLNSQHVEAGFVRPGFGGKYYCLRAKGNQQGTSGDYSYEYPLWTSQTLSHGGPGAPADWASNDREKRYLLVPAGTTINMDEIDYIKVEVDGSDNNWFPNSASTFYIRNGLKTKYGGTGWSIEGKENQFTDPPQKLPGENQIVPLGAYAVSDGSELTANGTSTWYLRYDDGEGDDAGGPHFQYADPTEKDVFARFMDILSEGPQDDDRNCGSLDVNGRDGFQSCKRAAAGSGDWDDSDDGCALRAVFVNKRLAKINFACFTGEMDDVERVTYSVKVGLRESCTYVAQTEASSYETVGWTDRLWSNTKFSGVSNLNYTFNNASQPYGSLPLELSTDKLVNIYSIYDRTTFDPPPAVAGSPYSCAGNCLATAPVVSSTSTNFASATSLIAGREKLGEIFAKIKELWVWSGSVYQSQLPSALDVYNVTETATDQSRAPKIRPLGPCNRTGKCLESSLDSVTVNGKSSGDVVFQSPSAPVNIKFYAYANQNQMPIRKLTVDWGDETDVKLNGYFRNQRGAVDGTCDVGGSKTCKLPTSPTASVDTKQSCVSSLDCKFLNYCQPENLAPNFGQVQDMSCDSAYFRFDHVYQCVENGIGWKAGAECSSEDFRGQYGGCCEFKPKVQAKDNWGWCNGGCEGGVGGEGCYDAGWKGEMDECDDLNNPARQPFTDFNGTIIVAPLKTNP